MATQPWIYIILRDLRVNIGDSRSVVLMRFFKDTTRFPVSFLILKRARPFNFFHIRLFVSTTAVNDLLVVEKNDVLYILNLLTTCHMMSFVFTTTQKIQNLQYDRKNQKSDQFTDRQAYAGTSNNDKIAWTFCSGELNRWFIVHAIFRENTIENQILCIVRFEVYALSPLNLDVKCVQVNNLFILQGDIVFI